MRDLLRRLSPWLALGSLIIVTRYWYFDAQDLTDMPGASGAKLLATAAQGRFHNDWATWVVGCLLPLASGDVLLASKIASMAGGIAAALGAILAGAAVSGRSGALGVGLIVGCWSMATWLPLLTGPDPLVFGAAWLAIGLTWAGFSLEFKGIPLVIAGGWLGMFSVALRETTIPTLAFLALAPLLLRSWRVVPSLLAMALGVYVGWNFLPNSLNHTEHLNDAALSIQSLKTGWRWVLELQMRHMPEGRFGLLAILCTVGALFPGPRWLRRVLIGAAALIIFSYTAAVLGPKTRPRHLTSVAFGLVVMTGILGGIAADHLRRWPMIQWVPVIGLAGFMSLDTLAFMNDWGQYRARITGGNAPDLPAAPEIFRLRYAGDSDLNHRDLTAYGAVDLVELVVDNPGGIAIPRLRDSRQYHLIAAAELRGLPWLILDPGQCCNEQENICARRLMAELNDANMAILLPSEIKGIHRINRSDDRWNTALKIAMTNTDKIEETPFWSIVYPDGPKTSPIPCPNSNANLRSEGAAFEGTSNHNQRRFVQPQTDHH